MQGGIKRSKNDFYKTPDKVVDGILQELSKSIVFRSKFILDPGAGEGAWGRGVGRFIPQLWPATLIAVDLEQRMDYSPETGVFPYYSYQVGDFLSEPNESDLWVSPRRFWKTWPEKYDIVIGNPPYSHDEQFVQRGLDLLIEGGWLIYLLPQRFLATEKRYRAFYQNPQTQPKYVYTCASRISWTGDGKTDDTIFNVIVWQKPFANGGNIGNTEQRWIAPWKDYGCLEQK